MSLTALAIALSLAATPVMAAANLAEVQWEKRVLVVFAPADSPALAEQQRLLAAASAGLEERDMLVLSVSGDDVTALHGDANGFQAAGLRTSLADLPDSFETVLVGKDGGIKRRWTTPVSVEDLFAIIDAMPMRASEMARQY